MKEKKIKVFIIIPGMKFGGMERVSFIMRDILIKNGYNVFLITLHNKNPDYHPNFEYYSLGDNVSSSKVGKLLATFKRIKKLKKLKKEFKPDLVIAFGVNSAFASYFSRRGEKLYVGIRSYDWLYKYTYSFKIDKYIYNKADKIISVSKLIKREAESIFNIDKERSYYLYNPYDLKVIADESNEEVVDFDLSKLKNKKVIVSVGRLEDQKGFYHLIKAINSLDCELRKKVIVLILGNGTRREKIENMVKSGGLDKIVFLLGGKENPYKYMKLANLYVMPSISEGFPNSLVEAMSLGLPVLSADCKSGPREIMTKLSFNDKIGDLYYGEYGILSSEVTDSKNYDINEIEECDIALSDAIKKVLFDKKLLLGYSKLSKERAAIFSYDLFEKRLLDIINEG